MALIDNFDPGSLQNRVSSLLGDSSKKVTDIFSGSVDPSKLRLEAAKLFPGAFAAKIGADTTVKYLGASSIFGPPVESVEDDWRVSINVSGKSNILHYSPDASDTLKALIQTNGVVFPYTPSITVAHKANYQSARLTHSNYSAFFYEGSEVNEISITGDFTVQNQYEGRYLLACLYFFRAATKMFFGQGNNVGNPPPVVFLKGYGKTYFPDVSCVITSFSHNMPADVDYVPIKLGEGDVVRLPTTSQITVGLQPVYSRKNIAKNFDMQKFANGGLLNNRFI